MKAFPEISPHMSAKALRVVNVEDAIGFARDIP